MTRKEAREWLLDHIPSKTIMPEAYSAYQTAIFALCPVSREQVEKWRGEWQICFEDWRKQMAGDQCSKCGFQHYGTSINHYKFCPACGAAQTDEAVDMMLEKWKDVLNEH